MKTITAHAAKDLRIENHDDPTPGPYVRLYDRRDDPEEDDKRGDRRSGDKPGQQLDPKDDQADRDCGQGSFLCAGQSHGRSYWGN